MSRAATPSPRTLAACLLAAALAGCHPELPPPAATPAPTPTPAATMPIIGVHYFGRQWPKNFIAGFRRSDVAEDFRQLREDGFNTVVLLVSWGDFQPVHTPCCSYDERAWERLRFLLREAADADLQVALRVGYAWTYHPQAGDSSQRVHQLMNDAGVRASYQQFVQRLAREIADAPQVTLTFMSWEDQWLHRLEESARQDFQRFRQAGGQPAWNGDLPSADGDHAEVFHAYWDWLKRHQLYQPALAALPQLSYEVRVDKEPQWTTAADGARSVARWIDHHASYDLPAGRPLTIYWAPFWGARNEGELLGADESLKLFAGLLGETAALAQGKPLFIDQFNVVDNTVGYERNAALAPDQVPAFLGRAVCLMREHKLAGYAFWTGRDYAESSLFNPAFGYGLDGWLLTSARAPRDVLRALPGGDFEVALRSGEVLAQRIGMERGRLPQADALADRVCVQAVVDAPATLQVQAGRGAPLQMAFAGEGRQQRCAAIESVPEGESLTLALTVTRGELSLRDVKLFDHVQRGDLYGFDGQPGPLLDSVRQMNADMAQAPMPARCTPTAP